MSGCRRTTITAVLVAVLGACATFSPDGGMADVRKLAQDRLAMPVRDTDLAGDAEAARKALELLLAQPLSADSAIEIALLNNPGLKAQLADLGLAETDLVRAGRLRNPVFAYSNKRNSDVTQIERTLLVNVAALVFMPLALDIEQRRFEQAKVAAAMSIVSTAAATRQAYFRAVAAQEMLTYFNQVKVSAEASSELARRMAQVGNFSKLAQMREQVFYAEATAQLARAQRSAIAEREQLTRMLGLAGNDASYTLPARLPDLPAVPLVPADAEQAALQRRLDVQIAKLDAEGVAKSLGLTRATRFVNVLEVGYTNESETGERRKNGYEIELELPIFDWGDARVARAELLYRQAMARTSEVAINAQSEVREAYAAYRTAFDLAKHYRDEIVPLRRRIADENLLRYNGMLIGVFELMADAREQVGSVNAAIEATRDYWLAETALQLALSGKSPGSAVPGGSAVSSARAPAAGGH
jgi:outer membrane protein TolC